MPPRLPRIPYVSIVTAVLAAAAVGCITYISTRSLVNAEHWVNRCYEVMGELEALSDVLLSADISAKDYLLTREPSYLQAAASKTNAVNAHIDKIALLTIDSKKLQQHLPELRSNVADAVGATRELLNRAESNNHDQPSSALLSKANAGMMKARLTAATMRSEERLLLSSRVRDAARSSQLATYSAILPAWIALMLLVGFQYAKTRRTRAVEELKVSAETRLQEQSAWLESILDTLASGVVVADENGKFILFNRFASKILGLGATETQPQDWTERYGAFLPDAVTPCPAEQLPLFRAIRGAESTNVELAIKTSPDATPVWIRVNGRPLKDATGAIKGGTVVFQDISDLHALKETLTEKNHQLSRALSVKDRFLATMSHELRTPLNSILGFTSTLLMGLPGKLNDEQKRQLGFVDVSGKHLLALINEILDLAKVESETAEVAIATESCSDMLRELVNIMEPLARAKGLNLSFENPGGDAVVKTDRRILKQIMTNLINNAIKFTDQGQVTVTLEKTADDVTLAVVDTGRGIKSTEQNQIFDAFSKISSGTAQEGTGLGLYICRRLADLLGAEITVTSEHGKGSQFSVHLKQAPIAG